MRKFLVVGILGLVVGLTIAGYFSFRGSAEAAKPFLSIDHVHVHDAGGCDLSTHITWSGPTFAHRNGKLFSILTADGAGFLSMNISKGTLEDDFTHNWGAQIPGTYHTLVRFWFARGNDGVSFGKFIALDVSADHVC